MIKEQKIKNNIKKIDNSEFDNLLLNYQIDFSVNFNSKKKRKKLVKYFANNNEEYNLFKKKYQVLSLNYWQKQKKANIIDELKKDNIIFNEKSNKKSLIYLITLNKYFYFSNNDELIFKNSLKKINFLIKETKKREYKAELKEIWKNPFSKNFFKKLNNYFGKYKFGVFDSNYEIELKNVDKFFNHGNKLDHVLKNVNIQIPKSKILIIVGPSGSGKSTLVNVISGLLTTERGDIIISNFNLKYFDEKERTKFREKYISFVFQSYNLISTLKCKDNILLGSDLIASKKNKLNIKDISKELGIFEQLEKFPNQISGGQKQRVSIARALVKNPKILIADEPTGALDKKAGKDVLNIFNHIKNTYGTTIILVTHNPEITKIGDYILSIKNGQIESFVENLSKINVEELKLEM